MNPVQDRPHPESLPAAGKYLSFSLGREMFAIPVLKVREIMRICPITPVPKTPLHIQGVINLRGKIVPVIDLRTRFRMPASPNRERLCIIVVQYQGTDEALHLMGMVVDVVDEVIHLATDQLRPTPDFGAALDTRFITGMAEARGRVKTLLDLDKLLSADGEVMGPSPSSEPIATA